MSCPDVSFLVWPNGVGQTVADHLWLVHGIKASEGGVKLIAWADLNGGMVNPHQMPWPLIGCDSVIP